MSMGISLALDTAMNGCCAGIYNSKSGKGISRRQPMIRGQAEAIVPMVSDVVASAELKFSDIGLIVTTVGPGAFTGLRIGISTAKSFGLALGVPVFGITTLQALAFQYARKNNNNNNNKKLAVVIETKRSDFYFQSFSGEGRPVSEAMALPASEILMHANGESLVFIGDAIKRFQDSIEPEQLSQYRFEDGYELTDPALIAQALSEQGQDVYEDSMFTTNTSPVYLRGADVSKSKKIQRVLDSRFCQ